RLKDMIIRGGEKVYPRGIEEVLSTPPGGGGAEGVGLPGARFGGEGRARVPPKAGGQGTGGEVKKLCRSRIAHFKVPRYVVFVEEYPKTVTGKIQKFKLREMGIARFALEKAASVETA